MQPWDGWFDVLFSGFVGFVFCPSFVFPTNLCLALLGHWLGLLYVPLSFCPVMASSSISSASCCRAAQLFGNMSVGVLKLWICHMFLENLTWPWKLFQFERLWHSKFWKLQKLALSFWAWNFVWFSSIFMFSRSCFGKCFLKPLRGLFLVVSATPWRSNPLCSLASSLQWALELQPTPPPATPAQWFPAGKTWAATQLTRAVMSPIMGIEGGGVGEGLLTAGEEQLGHEGHSKGLWCFMPCL